tara:strand:+ start:5184 stop:6161 length:978 start_codon:yes stop_codon:yes gene_type:complete
MDKVAVIGAGISGLALANKLKKHFEVVVFEKSRGYGGRVATRRAGEFIFDHGAQFFKVKTDEFREYIKPMIDQGVVDIWKARFVEIDNGKITNNRIWGDDPSNYIGTPSMNSIGKYMADGLDVRLSDKVANVAQGTKWELYDEAGANIGEFDWVVSAIPPKQVIEMIPDVINLYSKISSYEMLACYSLMLGYEEKMDIGFDAALIKGADISWLSVNSSKLPGANNTTFLIHSTNKWASQNIDRDRDWVKGYLCNELSNLVPIKTESANYIGLQGWRYANIKKQNNIEFFLDKDNKFGLCGDWFVQGRIEAAYLSGSHLGDQMLIS